MYRQQSYLVAGKWNFLQGLLRAIAGAILTVISEGALSVATINALISVITQYAGNNKRANALISVLTRFLNHLRDIDHINTDDVYLYVNKDQRVYNADLYFYLKTVYESQYWHPWALIYWLFQLAENNDEIMAVYELALLLNEFHGISANEWANVQLSFDIDLKGRWFPFRVDETEITVQQMLHRVGHKIIPHLIRPMFRDKLLSTEYVIPAYCINGKIVKTRRCRRINHYKQVCYFVPELESPCGLNLGKINVILNIPAYNSQELHYIVLALEQFLKIHMANGFGFTETPVGNRILEWKEFLPFTMNLEGYSIVEHSSGFVITQSGDDSSDDSSDDSGDTSNGEQLSPEDGKNALKLLGLLLLISMLGGGGE